MIHYSQDTWYSTFQILLGWRGSIYKSIWITVLIWSLWGLIVAYLGTSIKDNSIDNGWGIDDTMHSMAATALGFLLVFRAQVAYQRFWDARTVFTYLCADSREVGCMLVTYVDNTRPDAQLRRTNAARLIGAFVALVTNILNSKDRVPDYTFLQVFLTETEIERVRTCRGNRPVMILTWLRQEVSDMNRRGYIGRLSLRLVDPRISALCNSWHILSRILTTPVPFPYVQMLQVSLALYFTVLPLVFLPKLGFNAKIRMQMPFIMAIFTFVFYGIKNLSWELEAPFGIADNKLPLQTLAAAVQTDLLLFLRDDKCQTQGMAQLTSHSILPRPPKTRKPGRRAKKPAAAASASSIDAEFTTTSIDASLLDRDSSIDDRDNDDAASLICLSQGHSQLNIFQRSSPRLHTDLDPRLKSPQSKPADDAPADPKRAAPFRAPPTADAPAKPSAVAPMTASRRPAEASRSFQNGRNSSFKLMGSAGQPRLEAPSHSLLPTAPEPPVWNKLIDTPSQKHLTEASPSRDALHLPGAPSRDHQPPHSHGLVASDNAHAQVPPPWVPSPTHTLLHLTSPPSPLPQRSKSYAVTRDTPPSPPLALSAPRTGGNDKSKGRRMSKSNSVSTLAPSVALPYSLLRVSPKHSPNDSPMLSPRHDRLHAVDPLDLDETPRDHVLELASATEMPP